MPRRDQRTRRARADGEDTPAAQASPVRRWPAFLLPLLLILLIGSSLRLYDLTSRSLWLDELFSIASSTGHYPDMSPLEVNRWMDRSPDFSSLDEARPWWQIWSVMRDGTHPPLYIVVLRWWRELLGEGDAAARLLSVVASLAAMALIFDVGRLLHGPVPGLWAAALSAVAWPQLQYAREARPYALLLALGLGACSALVRIEKEGITALRLVALGLCMLAMALTHYFSFPALLALGLYSAVTLRGRARWLVLGTMAAAAVLFLVSWGPGLWHQRHNTEFDFLTERGASHILLTLRRLDEVPQKFFFGEGLEHGLPGVGLALVIPGLVLLRRRPDLRFPALWLLSTLVFMAALDLFRSTRHLAYIRYTLLASPGLYLMLAALLRSHRFFSHALPAALVLACVALLPRFYGEPRANWRGLARAVLEAGPVEQPLLFAAGREAPYAPAMCMGLSHYEHDNRRPVAVLESPVPPDLLDRLRRCTRLTLVGYELQPESLLPGFRVIDQLELSMATIYLMEPAPQPRQ